MKNITISPLAVSDSAIKVVIEGDLVVGESTALQQELLKWLNSCQSIEIVFKNINKLDISVLQLLAAMQNSGTKKQREVILHFEESEYVTRMMTTSGYMHLLTNSSLAYDK
jgi:ABC-type transporter Mla MlaB component